MLIVLDEKTIVIEKGVATIEDGKTSSEQRHAELEVYIGQQKKLGLNKKLYKYIPPSKLEHIFP
jgi:hypothetical protein